jgi:hypothetical protein
MENEIPDPERFPTQADLSQLCRELNARGARYLVLGGFAIIHYGMVRATEDIDILIEGSLENQRLVREALATLPDKAILELGEHEDMRHYGVIRVGDEITVDIMLSACGIGYDEASPQTQMVEVSGVPIPFATPELLWRTKQTVREKDIPDRLFLQELFEKRKQGG